jgi:hypothetical protein
MTPIKPRYIGAAVMFVSTVTGVATIELVSSASTPWIQLPLDIAGKSLSFPSEVLCGIVDRWPPNRWPAFVLMIAVNSLLGLIAGQFVGMIIRFHKLSREGR